MSIKKLTSLIKNSVPNLNAQFPSELGCSELPRKLRKFERKSLVTRITELKRKSRLEKQERNVIQEVLLHPPENGLLVKELIPVAHEVFSARSLLSASVSKVAPTVIIYTCRSCEEVHVGHPPHNIKTCTNKEHDWTIGGIEQVLPLVESFHLYDRLGRAVSHEERLQVDRVPAIVELCIQAGLDIPEYPTRRRSFPVYRVAGRMLDFERRFPKEDSSEKDTTSFLNKRKKNRREMEKSSMKGFACEGMWAWERMRRGAMKLMNAYGVQTCGYCFEVQVGSKGHRVRDCQRYKHQMRAGQHAWQEATVDDVVPPVYVWHVREEGRLMVDGLKKYYGKLPAVVELFAQAGAPVGEHYSRIMREDVSVPELHEEHLLV
ncbi:APO protein 3, mitochondrial-like [Impatiens glandulifera]|uniref:APO protein 3, mitochondrial-like n=1 Tax=Impatiens glandulifera TaxID=253017 RepID=UPI001FB19A2B|nr:APO protein 3, mitochondrial-like [Impatiens glandulifera]